MRVPVPTGSVVDLTLELGRNTTAEEINEVLKAHTNETLEFFSEKQLYDPALTASIEFYPLDSWYLETFLKNHKENGWVKKCIYAGSAGRELAPDNYMLFDREYPERLNGRQLWPIFSVNVGQSNGALWNDYDYVNAAGE